MREVFKEKLSDQAGIDETSILCFEDRYQAAGIDFQKPNAVNTYRIQQTNKILTVPIGFVIQVDLHWVISHIHLLEQE